VNPKLEDSGGDFTRRGLLKGLMGFFGALGIGGALYGLHGFLARGEGVQSPVEISLDDIPPGGASQFLYGGVAGILIRNEEEGFEAFSLVCTHLGCNVVWKPDKKEFHCPCHDGLFDGRGNVISGPPPAPLERWKVKVDSGKVVIG
jgi:cytochrome b6-f complex iron-sulfur subunit